MLCYLSWCVGSSTDDDDDDDGGDDDDDDMSCPPDYPFRSD